MGIYRVSVHFTANVYPAAYTSLTTQTGGIASLLLTYYILLLAVPLNKYISECVVLCVTTAYVSFFYLLSFFVFQALQASPLHLNLATAALLCLGQSS